MNNVEFNNLRFSRAESPNVNKKNLLFINNNPKVSKTPTKPNTKPNQFRMQKIPMKTDVKTELNIETREDLENPRSEVRVNDLRNFKILNKSGFLKKYVPFDKAESYVNDLLKKK
jgi:hypothetical protein